MSQINKGTRYFLMAVVLFGIIPLIAMRVSDPKRKAEAAKVIAEIPQMENFYQAKPENIPGSLPEKNILLTRRINIDPLPRDPFSAEKVLNFLIASQNEFDSESSIDNEGKGNPNILNNLKLKGIVIDGESKYSIINDSVLEEGDNINGMTVISIKRGEVVIGNGSKTYPLILNDSGYHE